jgi:DNA-binding MarR family transcriptional regulator
MQALLGHQQMKMNELARFLGLSKANASGLVDRLARQGLIDRQHSEEDRRVVFVRLTHAGRRAAAGLVKTQRQGLAQLMRRIPEKDLGQFIATIEQLARGLAETQPDLLPPPLK